jgi:hypothetical protein
VDKIYLQAESLHHAHTQIPFWLEIQVVPENDSPPHLAEPYRTDPHKLAIHVKTERIFYHSLLPWLDGDSQATTSLDFFFPELFREVSFNILSSFKTSFSSQFVADIPPKFQSVTLQLPTCIPALY